jgi:DNA-directed RNA polymerase specialized sigma subunit, sigma24 homolog
LEDLDRAELNDLVAKMKVEPNGPFPRFYELTKNKVFYLIFSYVHDYATSEDLLQETYVSFLDSLHKLSVELNPLGYLLSTGKNKALDYLRSHSKVVDVEEETLDYLGESEEHYDGTGELLKKIRGLLNPLRVPNLHSPRAERPDLSGNLPGGPSAGGDSDLRV